MEGIQYFGASTELPLWRHGEPSAHLHVSEHGRWRQVWLRRSHPRDGAFLVWKSGDLQKLVKFLAKRRINDVFRD